MTDPTAGAPHIPAKVASLLPHPSWFRMPLKLGAGACKWQYSLTSGWSARRCGNGRL